MSQSLTGLHASVNFNGIESATHTSDLKAFKSKMSGSFKPMGAGKITDSSSSQDLLVPASTGSVPVRPGLSNRNRVPSSQSLSGRGRPTPPATPPVANIPPRTGTPGSSYKPSGIASGSFDGQPRSYKSTAAAPVDVDLDNVPEEEKARVLRRHLVSREERQNRDDQRSHSDSDFEPEPEPDPSDNSNNRIDFEATNSKAAKDLSESDVFPVPYETPGGDITHSVYKWQSKKSPRSSVRPRASSFSAPSTSVVDPAFEHIHEPGGFRRNYVLLRANELGETKPTLLNNFIDFLYIFGHFAGEDLEEDEEIDETLVSEQLERAVPADREVPKSATTIDFRLYNTDSIERAPLLPRENSKGSLSREFRRRRSSVGPHGDATVTQAVLMLLKGFVGTGILFLGKAFLNGGILFSSLTVSFIALVSLWSFLLLIKTKLVVPGSFGDIGGALYGPWMRYAILTSITLSQIGFVSAYTIFVASNLQAFIMALIVILPSSLVRNIAKLSTAALVADVFILAGLLYIFGSEISLIAKRGIAPVELFNPKDFPLLIGTAVFSFEGIGLVIPITDAMREPHKFSKVLTGVMLFLTVLFGGAGALAYAAFGPEIQTVVIVNLDGESKFVQAVQFLYSMAILLSVPLQLFPAIRIMENGLFSKSGKADFKVKWEKNAFRFVVVLFCTGISWLGAQDLDKFVALIGSFACVPLCYVYPPMLHYKARAKTRKAKLMDILLIIFGCAAAVYTTAQTIRLMLTPESGEAPQFGKCGSPPAI